MRSAAKNSGARRAFSSLARRTPSSRVVTAVRRTRKLNQALSAQKDSSAASRSTALRALTKKARTDAARRRCCEHGKHQAKAVRKPVPLETGRSPGGAPAVMGVEQTSRTLEDRLRRRSARPAVTTVPSLHPRAGKGQRQRGKEKRRGRRSTPGTRAEVLPRAKRSKKAFPGAGKTKDAPQRADGAPAAGAEGRRGNRVEKERDEQREGRQAFGKRSPVRSDGPQEGIVSEKRFFRWQNGRPQGRKTLPRNPVTALTDKRSAANGFLHRQRATCAGKRLRPQNKRPMPDDATSPLNERHAGNIPRAPCKEILRKEKRCPRRQGTRPARQKRRQAPATA